MEDSSLGIWFSCLGSGFGGRRGRNLGIGLLEEEEEEEEESESLRISSTVRRVVRSVWLSSSSSLLLVVWDWRKESRSSSVGVLVSIFVMAEFSFFLLLGEEGVDSRWSPSERGKHSNELLRN